MTKIHKIREIVENSLEDSERYLATKDISKDVARYYWGAGLVDAYKFILEKIRQVESLDTMVEDESQ